MLLYSPPRFANARSLDAVPREKVLLFAVFQPRTRHVYQPQSNLVLLSAGSAHFADVVKARATCEQLAG